MSGTARIVDGSIELPDGPGVTLDETAMAASPYADRNGLRLFEGGWDRRKPGAASPYSATAGVLGWP